MCVDHVWLYQGPGNRKRIAGPGPRISVLRPSVWLPKLGTKHPHTSRMIPMPTRTDAPGRIARWSSSCINAVIVTLQNTNSPGTGFLAASTTLGGSRKCSRLAHPRPHLHPLRHPHPLPPAPQRGSTRSRANSASYLGRALEVSALPSIPAHTSMQARATV